MVLVATVLVLRILRAQIQNGLRPRLVACINWYRKLANVPIMCLRPFPHNPMLVSKVERHSFLRTLSHNAPPSSGAGLAPSALAKDVSRFCCEGDDAVAVVAPFGFCLFPTRSRRPSKARRSLPVATCSRPAPSGLGSWSWPTSGFSSLVPLDLDR